MTRDEPPDMSRDPRMPLQMQQVRLDRDGIPHNVGWMTAASDEQLTREFQRTDEAWQATRGRDHRALWWLDRVDDEDKRRQGWTQQQIDRRDQQITRRREREARSGPSGRLYRAAYRWRDDHQR